VADREIVYEPSPTLAKFHASNALVRGIRGPFGSGKSVGCCWEIWSRACEQRPNADRKRKSRWVVTRNTYGELTSTTIKTWLDWFPEERFGKLVEKAPIEYTMRWNLDDGTSVELEMLFLALDRPEHVKKLLSLEVSGAWMNEGREQPKAILDGLTGRVGRYPRAEDGGCTWSGVIMDTNSPDDDHWWYLLAEVLKPENHAFFVQPPGDSEEGENHDWLMQTPETLALPVGHPTRRAQGRTYYERLKPGKTPEWIKVYVKGQYGTVHDGKPVYPEWNDTLHVKAIQPLQGIPLDIGLDYGLTPAAVITQTDSRGRLLVLDELCGEDMAIRQFLQDVLVPQLVKVYPTWWAKKDAKEPMIRCFGDPAGKQKAQTDEKTCEQEVRAVGLHIRGARTNGFVARRSGVAWFLSKLSGGQPMFVLDPCCAVLRKGFNGGYKYRRIQVTGEERYTDEPVKNAYSHPHDALQYVALESGGVQAMQEAPPPPRLPRFRIADAATGVM
jgi:hypothetical protein